MKNKKNKNTNTKSRNSQEIGRHKKKVLGNIFFNRMAEFNKTSQRLQKYINSTFCNDNKIWHEGKYISRYCKNRSCLICDNIRTANLINGYKPIFEEMIKAGNLYFVTLTDKTITGDQLKAKLRKNNKILYSIRNKLNRRGVATNGLRKIEVTARPNKLFHPHLHLLIEGKEAGNMIINEWIKKNKTAKRAAQNIKKADEGSLKELFKYFTKLSNGKENNYSNITKEQAKAIDTILCSLEGLRLFQSFGNIKKIQEDENEEGEDLFNIEAIDQYQPKNARGIIWQWNSDIFTYVSEFGEVWLPSTLHKKVLRFVSKFKSCANLSREKREEVFLLDHSPP